MGVWLVVSILLIVGWGQTALAQTLEGEFKTWRVFTLTRDKQKMCYVTGSPVTKTGTAKRPDIPYVVVAHRGPNLVEVSVSAGYSYKDQSTAEITIDARPAHEFFTSAKTPKIAWARDAAADKSVVDDMLQGGKMTVAGTGQGKIASKDTYNLQGFSQAYARMQDLCSGDKKTPKAAGMQDDKTSGPKNTKASTKSKATTPEGKASTKQAPPANDKQDSRATKTKAGQATEKKAPPATRVNKDGKAPAKKTSQPPGMKQDGKATEKKAPPATRVNKDGKAPAKKTSQPPRKPDNKTGAKSGAQEERTRQP